MDYRQSVARCSCSCFVYIFLRIFNLFDNTERKKKYGKILRDEMCAIVTSKDSIYAMSRMHAMHMEITDVKTRVFRDMKVAIAWLDVDVGVEQLDVSS